MTKRKKYPKLPNGYGSIKFLKQKKRNQYAVHPPTTEFTEDGVPITPKALCYVPDWYTGFAVLTAYKAGTYVKGMEKELSFRQNPEDTVNRIIADYTRYRHVSLNDIRPLTFAEVYELYFNDKYVNTKRQYTKSALQSARSAFKNCQSLHDRPFNELTLDDLQTVIDSCPLRHASLELIKNLFRGMYKYAVPHGIVDTDLSAYVKINVPDDDIHGVPLSESELHSLWELRSDITAQRILIMCFSGFRISAYKDISILDGCFMGGVKTTAGKGRTVPIHHAIMPLVQTADITAIRAKSFRKKMHLLLAKAGLPDHTPHDCRHTFSMLCDKYEVNPIAKKKMLGHSLTNDITNGIYGHWSPDMLHEEIEKIRAIWEFD